MIGQHQRGFRPVNRVRRRRPARQLTAFEVIKPSSGSDQIKTFYIIAKNCQELLKLLALSTGKILRNYRANHH